MSDRGKLVVYESIYAHRRLKELASASLDELIAINRRPTGCQWCGDPIELVNPDDYRRRARTRHRGDEHELTERNCHREFLRSYVYSERELIEVRGDDCCVDCGSTGPWEADHDKPLWAGGEHCASNIVRRCVPCHRRKTREEATERATLRRQERGLPDPLPAHHPGQAQLLEIAA